jgi:nucleoid-associated protein YgaU
VSEDKTPAEGAEANNPYTQIHVVVAGDTLSKVTQKYYGDAALYTSIFEANRDVLSDRNEIFPDQKLCIP